MKVLSSIFVIFLCLISSGFKPEDLPQGYPDMIKINGGSYKPLYSFDTGRVKVEPFLLDKTPVTNAQFSEFVKSNKKWQQGNVSPLFADKNYLKHWKADSIKNSNQPVTNVSWFAAKEYCECQGKRLASVDEWEFVALASDTKPNGAVDPEFYQKILDWYSKPTGNSVPEVGTGFKNYYGIWDMHGLVWEWVNDFNTSMITGESRSDTGIDRNLFCGSGANGAADPSNYAAFMRYAFRASLKANYSVSNLGFRCAKDIQQ